MTITWLGQAETDPSRAAGEAAQKEAMDAEWPPTRENAQAVGAAAGAAAATAGCAAAGAATAGATTILAASGICGAIGAEIGAFVGGVVFDVAESFFGRSDATRRHLDAISRQARLRAEISKAGIRLCDLRRAQGETIDCGVINEQLLLQCGREVAVAAASPTYGTCATYPPFQSKSESARLFRNWGLPSGRGYTWDLQEDAQLVHMLRLLTAAEAGRGAEIISSRKLRVVLVPGDITLPPQPSSSSAAPLLIGAAVVAGIAWLALS